MKHQVLATESDVLHSFQVPLGPLCERNETVQLGTGSSYPTLSKAQPTSFNLSPIFWVQDGPDLVTSLGLQSLR